jgi:hypothetical protein
MLMHETRSPHRLKDDKNKREARRKDRMRADGRLPPRGLVVMPEHDTWKEDCDV